VKRKDGGTKCNDLKIGQKLVTKHNIKEKQKTQRLKNMLIMYRKGRVGTWMGEGYCRRKKHKIVQRKGTNIQ